MFLYQPPVSTLNSRNSFIMIVNRVLPYFTKLAMLSTLYFFVVKGKFIVKCFPPVGLEHQHLRIFIPMPI